MFGVRQRQFKLKTGWTLVIEQRDDKSGFSKAHATKD